MSPCCSASAAMSARAAPASVRSKAAVVKDERTITRLVRTGQPTVHFGLENIQRHGAVVQEFRMKGAHIESRPQTLFGALAQALEHSSAHGARQRLAGQCDHLVDRVAQARLIERHLSAQVNERLIARPTECMD